MTPRILFLACAAALAACGTVLQPEDRPRTARQVLAAAEIAETGVLNAAAKLLPSASLSASQKATLASLIVNVSKAFDSAEVVVKASPPCAFASADITPALPGCALNVVDSVNIARAALGELQKQLPKGN